MCLFECLHLASISFRLFKRLGCYDFRICIFSSVHKLQPFLPADVVGLLASIFQDSE